MPRGKTTVKKKSGSLPKFGLVMICKDEAAAISRCLESLKPYVGAWTILDTGSTDGTQDVVRETMAGVPGNLYEEPFVNFGSSRTRVFALAKDTARWLFATDSDMIWNIDEGWDPDEGDCDAYDVAMGSPGGFQWRLPLVHRGDLPWISVGAVHEYSALADGKVLVCLPAPAIHLDMSQAGNRGSMEKSLWHLSLLEEEYEGDPQNARTLFYLAQTLKDVGRLPEAREMYLKRAEMGGFLEEAYYAKYMAATLAEDWPTRQAELLATWESRPQRLEPLATLLRELNSLNLHYTAYLLAQVPVGPVPGNQFFIHENVWCWGIKFERSIAAYWVGRRDESLALCDELLAIPELPEHVRNQVVINRGYSAPSIPMFGELDVETVGSCNRTCPSCLRNSVPDKKAVAGRFGKPWQMPEPLYYKIIDDAVDMGFRGVLNLQHFNEPVQDPRIARFADYARSKGNFSQIVMHSNGDLLTERKAKELDGSLDVIRIALYDESGGRPMDETQAAPRRALLESWFSKTKLEWTGGGHLVTHFSPWTNHLEAAIKACRPTPCRREVQMRMIVTYTGEMALCCDDIACNWDLGNAADKTISELWFSPKHVEIMATLSNPGGREAYGYCRICPRPDGEWQAGPVI